MRRAGDILAGIVVELETVALRRPVGPEESDEGGETPRCFRWAVDAPWLKPLSPKNGRLGLSRLQGRHERGPVQTRVGH